MYLKYNGKPDIFRNEFNALRLINTYTSIPTPIIFDLAIKPADPDNNFSDSEAFLLILEVPGTPLAQCFDAISKQDYIKISLQIKDYLTEIQDISEKLNPDMQISNTLSLACQDPRIRGGIVVGAFANKAAFSQELRLSDKPSHQGHKIVFSHTDLNPRNILTKKITRRNGTSR